MYYKKFEGDRLYFSPITADDLKTFTKWLNDETLTRGLGSTANIVTELSEKNYLEEQERKGAYQFGVVLKSTDQLIGTYDLHAVDFVNRSAEVGGFIGEQGIRNQGYGTESLRMICDYGFNVLGLNCIVGHVYSFNYGSLKSCEKAGFKKAGEIEEHVFYNGQFYNRVILYITRKDFYKKWTTFVKPLPEKK